MTARFWPLSLGLALLMALAACQPPPPATPTPLPPTITIGLALDLSDLAGHYNIATPITTASFVLNTPLPHRSLLTALNDRDVAVAITLDAPAGAPETLTPLANTALAIVVHPENPISTLPPERLRAVFAGQISDWGDIGGLAGPITVVSREDGAATRSAFDRRVLAGNRPSQLALVRPSPASMAAYIAENPNAIGYLLLPHVTPDVKVLSIEGAFPGDDGYRYALPLLAITRAQPDGPLRDWLAWHQIDGAPLLPDGYTPLR